MNSANKWHRVNTSSQMMPNLLFLALNTQLNNNNGVQNIEWELVRERERERQR